jgi:hypothetical protein
MKQEIKEKKKIVICFTGSNSRAGPLSLARTRRAPSPWAHQSALPARVRVTGSRTCGANTSDPPLSSPARPGRAQLPARFPDSVATASGPTSGGHK